MKSLTRAVQKSHSPRPKGGVPSFSASWHLSPAYETQTGSQSAEAQDKDSPDPARELSAAEWLEWASVFA